MAEAITLDEFQARLKAKVERGLCLPLADAPRDGALVCLLVDYSTVDKDGSDHGHPLEDTADVAWTIGHNNFDNDGEDRWQFAGWCWSHDHYTEGHGTPIGWAPYKPEIAAQLHAMTAVTLHSAAIMDVLTERRRQPEIEGFTAEHDDRYAAGILELAGASYATAAAKAPNDYRFGPGHPPPLWPWAASWWKPTNPRRMLVKAAALIIAAIERIDRAAARCATSSTSEARHGT